MKQKTERENKKELSKEIEVPEGIEVTISHNEIILRKDSKELRRKIDRIIKLSKEGNKILIDTKRSRRFEKRTVGTLVGHIKNMINGLNEGFVYELEMCNVHFPMTAEFDKGKKELSIKNLLGEKFPRKLNISEGVEIEIKAPKIFIRSYDIEKAGRVASDLEKITKVRNRDRNKFQDGVFITKKPGREYI